MTDPMTRILNSGFLGSCPSGEGADQIVKALIKHIHALRWLLGTSAEAKAQAVPSNRACALFQDKKGEFRLYTLLYGSSEWSAQKRGRAPLSKGDFPDVDLSVRILLADEEFSEEDLRKAGPAPPGEAEVKTAGEQRLIETAFGAQPRGGKAERQREQSFLERLVFEALPKALYAFEKHSTFFSSSGLIRRALKLTVLEPGFMERLGGPGFEEMLKSGEAFIEYADVLDETTVLDITYNSPSVGAAEELRRLPPERLAVVHLLDDWYSRSRRRNRVPRTVWAKWIADLTPSSGPWIMYPGSRPDMEIKELRLLTAALAALMFSEPGSCIDPTAAFADFAARCEVRRALFEDGGLKYELLGGPVE